MSLIRVISWPSAPRMKGRVVRHQKVACVSATPCASPFLVVLRAVETEAQTQRAGQHDGFCLGPLPAYTCPAESLCCFQAGEPDLGVQTGHETVSLRCPKDAMCHLGREAPSRAGW